MSGAIRHATAGDLPCIAAIHDRAVRETAISWLWEPLSPDARRAWFDEHVAADRPILVAEDAGLVVGFANYAPFRAYHGYRETMEHSVYLDPSAHRRGVGRALMVRLLDEARKRGVHVMVAAIALPNDPSVGLHQALGFSRVGLMPEVGLKFGAYRDLLLMQMML